MASIDERLERLTERHEALTQTVELFARQSLENGHRMGELHHTVELLARQSVENGHQMGKLNHTVELLARQSVESDNRYLQRFELIATSLESLLKMVQNHERRIEHLEGDNAA